MEDSIKMEKITLFVTPEDKYFNHFMGHELIHSTSVQLLNTPNENLTKSQIKAKRIIIGYL